MAKSPAHDGPMTLRQVIPPGQPRRWPWIASGVVALVVSGIVGSGAAYLALGDESATVSPTSAATPAAAAATTASPTPTPTNSWTADPVRAFGQDANLIFGDNKVRVAVLDYQQPARNAQKPGTAGQEWAAARVRFCVDSGPVIDQADITQNLAWVLRFGDGTQAETARIGGVVLPEYPFLPPPVAAGNCLAGWITYPVAAGVRPTHVEYAYSKRLPRWAVPAS